MFQKLLRKNTENLGLGTQQPTDIWTVDLPNEEAGMLTTQPRHTMNVLIQWQVRLIAKGGNLMYDKG